METPWTHSYSRGIDWTAVSDGQNHQQSNPKMPTLINTILLFALLLSAADLFAEKGESVMFEPTQHPFTEAPPDTDDQAEKCQQLLRQIEELKGKPQRRHAAMERHKLECVN